MHLNFLPRCAEADCIPGMNLQTCPSEVCGQPQNGKDDGGLACTVRPQDTGKTTNVLLLPLDPIIKR